MATINGTTSGTRDFEKAEAFLNISFIDADGVEWKLPKGLPLLARQVVPNALIEAAKAAGEDGYAIQLKGTVHLVVDVADAPAPNLTLVAPAVAESES